VKLAKKSYIDPQRLPRLQGATLRRILGYTKPYRLRAISVIACMIGAAILNLAPAWFVKQIVDVAIPRGQTTYLWLCCVAMVVGPLLAGLLQVAQKYGAEWIGQQVMLDLRVALYRHLHGMPFAYFTRQKPGEAVSHVLNDVQGVGGVVSNTLIDIIQNSIVLVTTLVFVTILDWRLTLIAVAFLPLFVTPTRRVGRLKKELKRQVQSRMAELTGIVTETLSVSGALMIKAFDTHEAEVRRFRHKAEELQDLSLRQSLIGRWFAMTLKLFESIGPAMVFGIGGWLVITGQLPLGTVVAFVTVMKKLYSPASDLANVHVDLMTSYAYFDRVFAVLDRQSPLRDAVDARALSRPAGRVDFKNLSFTYEGDGIALSNIDLSVPAGMTVGVVGPSGAGKSTLASLLMRLYDPSEGAVLIDGEDVRDLTQGSLRAHMAVVTQETFLFHTTVLENLRYGSPLATRAQVESAAKRAQIHDLIASLPEGYNTIVGERGYRFSAGERQRLAIARAILKDPRILILDEATSALDSVSERAVQAALKPLLNNRTSLIIAHRLSTVQHADQIVVLNRGRIVERGTHDDLLSRRGLYARLWRSQAKRDARRRQVTAA
jgi:ATP-binding cassette subfamily B protein